MEIRKGQFFFHKRWLNEYNQPAACKIFCIRSDAVYFDLASARKAKSWLPINQFVEKAVHNPNA